MIGIPEMEGSYPVVVPERPSVQVAVLEKTGASWFSPSDDESLLPNVFFSVLPETEGIAMCEVGKVSSPWCGRCLSVPLMLKGVGRQKSRATATSLVK